MMSMARRVIAATAALALAAALSGCTTKVVTATPEDAAKNTVTASGNGEVLGTPDEATMSFGVTRHNEDAGVALSKASAVAARINKTLERQGIAKEDMQTTNVSVYPDYKNKGGKAVIDGYRASIDIRAKVKNLEKLGDVISALTKAGAQNVNGPSFDIGDDAPYRAEALKKAVDDARAQAQAMAEAAGKTVGDVSSITNTVVTVPGPVAWGVGATDATRFLRAGVPIEAGQMNIAADVTVVFELK